MIMVRRHITTIYSTMGYFHVAFEGLLLAQEGLTSHTCGHYDVFFAFLRFAKAK
jgi:hypothetical protein